MADTEPIPIPPVPTTPEPAGQEPTTASESTPPPAPVGPGAATPPRPRNGFGVASLVLGVASLVAVVSFILFPLGGVAAIVGTVLGIVALVRIDRGVGSNRGQAIAGVVCSAMALLLAVVFAVRVGTWVSDNQSSLRRLQSCLTRADDGPAVGQCFARFSIEISRR